jgi:hydrophobe/amphiphile efflux-1 (HAE1) family protein
MPWKGAIHHIIAEATVDASKGTIRGQAQSFSIYDNDQLTTAAPYNDIIIAYRNGAPVRIRDIGRAITAPYDSTIAGWVNNKRAVSLIVFKQQDANVIDTVDRIKAALPSLRANIPPSVNVQSVIDRTTTIRASVADVEFTLVLTMVLVVAVVFVFLLNVRSTIIPGLAVPISVIGTFAGMYALGYSLDNLSLMGLTIAVGFVIDDAIVEVENIERHIEEGMAPLAAAYKGSGEIRFTVLSISLSLIAVFIPFLFMSGIVGRLLHEFAMTVTVAILVSALVSLSLTPMLAGRFLKHKKPAAQQPRWVRAGEGVFAAIIGAYGRTLDVALRHPRLVLMSFGATLAATAWLFMILPKGFFPIQDTGFIIGQSQASPSVSPEEMATLQRRLISIVQSDPAVARLVSTVGGNRAPNQGFIYASLKPLDERRISAMGVVNRLRPKLAQVEGASLIMQPAQDINVGGRQSQGLFQYTLQSADPDELSRWTGKLFDKMKGISFIKDLISDQVLNGPTVTLTINRDKAASFGIQPSAIDAVLAAAYSQEQVTQYYTQLNTYKVILEVLPRLQGSVDTLSQLYVKSPSGQAVPLLSLVSVSTEPVAPLVINHQASFPSVTFSFNLAPGASLGQAVSAIDAVRQQMGLPATIIGSFQGNAQAFQTSLASEPFLVAAAVFVIYIILGVLYESYIHPITILSTLPSAGLGALLMMYMFHIDFTLISLIGLILLIGIVKKNGIMMVDFAIQAEREEGLSPLESIRKACLLRFRPILMTTVCAILGGLPLMVGTGTGSELRQPLGYAIVGGLIVSQVLTLYSTPVIYLLLDRLQNRVAKQNDARHRQIAGREAELAPAE